MIGSLIEAWPYLTLIGLGVGVLFLARPRPEANEHDVSDYHEPAPVNDAPASQPRYAEVDQQEPAFSFVLAERGLSQMREDLAAGDILPPAPAGMDAGAPLYAGMLFDSWHPETPEATAARFLREIGDQAKAKTAGRDMTGAFPVVRAA